MSLTSYRAAPPRARVIYEPGLEVLVLLNVRCFCILCALQTWQRPTLPCLKTKYHWRWNVSRPSSEWDRVQPLRHNHQVGEEHKYEKLVVFRADIELFSGADKQ